MARLKLSFAHLVTGCVLAVHLILLPTLYFGVGYVIRKSHEDLFSQHVKTIARILADEFETGPALDSAAQTQELLDRAIIYGEGQYAELIDRNGGIRSNLGAPDIRFDQRGDDTYFIVLPIVHAGRNMELRLGFDERPTRARIHLALDRMMLLLGGYLCLAIGIAYCFSNRLSRPIRRLREISRAIASGVYAQALRVETGVRELHELSVDLDAICSKLMGVNERLEEQIREKELAETRRDALEKQLRHRRRLETVGTLAGGIAHEFNNMLVPIMLFTDAALLGLPPGSASRTDLERVLAAARRAKNVAQKILTFSHVLGDTEITSIDMRAVVNDALDLFGALAPATVEIHTELAPNIPAVQGDATLASDLVMNLCTNALQAMQGMKGMLTVGLRYPQRGYDAAMTDPLVEFWVQDTGHGMDAATAERIFEPFFTTRPVGEGTGLGLALVDGIVKSFKGRIVVDSKPGAGTTIRIYLRPASDAGEKYRSEALRSAG